MFGDQTTPTTSLIIFGRFPIAARLTEPLPSIHGSQHNLSLMGGKQ